MLKNTKLVRRLAWLLCLSLVIGLVPMGIWSMPAEVKAVPEVAAVNLIKNGGFENGTNNWKWGIGNGYLTPSDDAHSGSASIKHTAGGTVGTKNGLSTTQKVDVEAGKTYKLSAWVKVLSGTGGFIFVHDGTNVYINEFTTATQWTEVTGTVTVPAGLTQLTVEFGNHSNQTIVFLIDDVVFEEVTGDPAPTETTEATQPTQDTQPTQATEPTVPDPNEVPVNGGFEAGLESWKSLNNMAAIETTDTHSGSNAIRYVDDSDKLAGYISQKVPVTPGKTYRVSAWVKYVSGDSGYVGIFGIGDASAFESTSKNTEWTQVSKIVTVPAGYTTATIEIGSFSGRVVTLLIDDVVFEEVTGDPTPTETTEATQPTQDTQPTQNTEPTEPDPNEVPVNGGFENGVANWVGHTNAISSSADDKHSGNASMLFTDGSNAAAPYVYQKVAVEPGKTYKVSAWVKRVSGKGGYIGIFGISNPVLKGFDEVDGWQLYSATVTILEGETQATIEIGASKANVVTFLIDDVVFEEIDGSQPEPTETTGATEATESGPVFNGGFENGVANWTGAGAASSFTDDKHSGNASMKYVDNSDKAAGYVKQKVSVEPGKTYTLIAWVKILEGKGGYIGIFGLGTGIDVIQGFTQSGDWTPHAITVTVPEGITQATIEIGAHGSQVVTFLIDDLTLEEGTVILPDPTETTETTEATTEATEPVDPMKPFEDNFEEFKAEGNANAGPARWSSNDDISKPLPMISLVDDGLSLDGNYLRLQKAGRWAIQSSAFPVEVGYEYTVTFMARKLADNDNFAGSVVISFVNSRGKLLAFEQAVAGKTYGAWTEETVKAVAPVGAVKAYIVFKLEYDDGRIEGDYAVDNLTVTRADTPDFEYEQDPELVEPTDFVKVFKDSFDNYFNPEGAAASVKVPVDWTVSEESASIGSATYDKYDGTLSLVVQGPRNMWARSPMIDVTPGYYYYADFVEKKLQQYNAGSGGYAAVVFVDANGEIVKEYREAIGTSMRWTEMEVGGQAPAGAVKLYVEFGILDSTGSPAYSVDNLIVLEGAAKLPASAPEATEPEASTPETTVPGTPADPDGNAPTGDHVAVMTAYTILTAAVILAVLVLKKRNFF